MFMTQAGAIDVPHIPKAEITLTGAERRGLRSDLQGTLEAAQ